MDVIKTCLYEWMIRQTNQSNLYAGGATLVVLGAAAPRENRKVAVTYKFSLCKVEYYTNATKQTHMIDSVQSSLNYL